MELNGLNDSQAEIIAQWLAAAETMRIEAEKQPERQAYSKALHKTQIEFEEALRDNNYIKILDLEKVCQKHDTEFLNLDSEKAVKCMANLNQLTSLFIDGMDEEKVRKKYLPVLEDLKAHGTRVRDASFEAGIRAQSRIIGGCIGHRSNYAEKSLYETRQNCLLAIKQEHQRNLDRAFGFDKKKTHSKEKEQGLSR